MRALHAVAAACLLGCSIEVDLTFVERRDCEREVEAGVAPPDRDPNPERDAGPDSPVADAAVEEESGVGCPTCAGALLGEHVLGPFCPGSVAHVAWASYVSCGCVDANACASVCAGGGWCNSVYPVEGVWADPTPTCAACLTAAGPSGCGDHGATCAKH